MHALHKLKGAVAVTVTPITADFAPNYEEIRRQTNWLCEKEITALFPCSSTGEFIKFKTEEKKQILKVVAEENRGRKKLIAGACGAHIPEILESVFAAKEYGYDACVICPPYYYPKTQTELVDFYQQTAEKADGMKIILYHVPFFTTGLTLDTIEKLMQIENIVGIKDSSANMKQIAHTNEIKSNQFLVYTGTDDCLLPALTAGCDGSMTALAGILPEWVSSVYKLVEEQRTQEAQMVQQSVLKLLRLADSLPFPMGYKILAELRGLKTGLSEAFYQKAEIANLRGQMKAELNRLIQGGCIDESNGLAGL